MFTADVFSQAHVEIWKQRIGLFEIAAATKANSSSFDVTYFWYTNKQRLYKSG